MKAFVIELWFWLRVIAFWCLAAMIIWRWLRTRQISKGHSILGEMTVFAAIALWLVLAFAKEFAYLFNPMFTMSLALWLGYDNWLFPDIKQFQKELDKNMATGGLFWRNSVLARYLTGQSPPTAKEWLTWKNAAIAGGVLLPIALLFGFTRVVHYIAEVDRAKTEAVQQSQTYTRQVVGSVKKEVVGAVQAATDTLSGIAQEAKSSAKQAVDAAQTAAKEGKEGRIQLEQKLDRNFRSGSKKSKADSRPNFYIAPAPKGLPQSQFTLPDVRPIPYENKSKKKGRKVSFEEGPETQQVPDSSWIHLAKFGESPKNQ